MTDLQPGMQFTAAPAGYLPTRFRVAASGRIMRQDWRLTTLTAADFDGVGTRDVFHEADDRTVQVPVSLIKRLGTVQDDLRRLGRVYDVLDEVVALLSQPTPTSEPMRGLDAKLDALGLRDPDEPARPDSLPFPHAKADRMLSEPPRIEDMAPGTRFVGRHVDPEECGGVDHAWFVIRPGARPLFVSDEGQHWSGDSIDPSTIRDVTPPKGDDHA